MLYEAITRVAGSNSTVLIRGESGTGKELVARALQSLSRRRDKPFISVNCAALPENLIEAELFGHEKGAFTGAHAARAGHVESAHTGTLFLDEIATLGLGLQSKLLRVLEDHAVQRLGSKHAKKIDFRLLTGTHEDLEAMVEAGRFREDLYYRIHVIPIVIPPLRDREGDVALLAEHFLKVYCEANEVPIKHLHGEALEVLEDYDWPGNVRQLENLIQRLVLLTPSPVIEVKHLPQQILSGSAAKQQALLIPEEGIDFDNEMERIERAYVEAALKRAQGRRFAAAELLHIPPHKMKYLCRKHGI
jgi:DNA-binding NtrC family response regulator